MTDELIYPQVNAVLFVSIGALITIILMGIVWQFTCMKQEETFNAYPFKPNGFNTFLKGQLNKRFKILKFLAVTKYAETERIEMSKIRNGIDLIKISVF